MAQFCESMYAELQMAIFAGTERLTFLDIQRHRGTVFELVALAEKYIMSNIHWRVHFDGSLQRKEIPEIPADAIREALINSFCHKDYGACQSNEVAIYKDRVEIYNPGSFPEGYKPEDFPKAYAYSESEISLPLYATLGVENARYVADSVLDTVRTYRR